MSLIAATQITAVATAVLAVFAIVTAVFAILAFRKQSTEVTTLQRQFDDQRTVNEKQTEVLALQAQELRESLAERKRERSEQRRAQAARVIITEERGPDPRVSQAQSAAGVPRNYSVGASVRNNSDQPIREVFIHWLVDGEIAAFKDPLGTLAPGQNGNYTRLLADSPGATTLGAVARFQDAAGLSWESRPDGYLEERQP